MLCSIVAAIICQGYLSTAVLASWKDVREASDRSYAFGNFKIFYTLKGLNAFPGDAAARERGVLASRCPRPETPLTQPALSGGATSIGIHILTLAESRV